MWKWLPRLGVVVCCIATFHSQAAGWARLLVDDVDYNSLPDSLRYSPVTDYPAQSAESSPTSTSVAAAQGWYDPAWQYRKPLVIGHTYVGADLTDFPLLVEVKLDSGAQPDGDDVLFTDVAGARLAHEIEHYDAASGDLVAWVRIPGLSSTTDTVVYLYYGNPTATNQQNPASVWDSHYVMVQHLEEISGDHNDSTLYANHGIPSVSTQGSAIGRIDGADAFDGVDDYVDCGSDSSLDITGSMTVEAWAFSSGGAARHRIVAKDRTGVPGKFLLWNVDGYLAFQVADDGQTWHRAQGPPITHGEWMHVVGVFDAVTQQVRLYKNGVSVAVVNGPPSTQSNPFTTLTIGASEDDKHNWSGIIDEVRISNVARSAEWISATYENVNRRGSFYVAGSEETQGQNTPPIIINVSPAGGSTDMPISLTEVRFTVTDGQNDLVDYSVTMTPDAIGGVQSGTDMSSGAEISIPIVGGPLEYDTVYTWAVDVTDSHGSGIVTHQDYTLATESRPPAPPAFTWWSISDPHLQTDLPGYRSLESAILDSTYGGDQGGQSFAWDIATVAGDWTGVPCPTDSEGQDLVNQWLGAGANPNHFYGVIGNHDANSSDNSWFEKWVDPLGQHTEFSMVDNNARPYPVQGAWDHYSFQTGNILFLMLGDRNEGPPPFGRLCTGGYPSGRMSLETYNWWVDQVESHPDYIIITVSHQGLFETTAYTGFDEGYQQGIHGGHSWADRTGSSMIYTIDDWTLDGLDENETYIGQRDFGFVKYLQDHPGAVDLWIHGHTHRNLYPGITFNGRSDVETKYGVTFINTGALTKKHAGPLAPYSRLFSFYENGSTVMMRTYVHSTGWGSVPEGFYAPADVLIELDKAFYPNYPCVDVDGDTFCASSDCNDLNPTVFPGAPETNDGIDNQCPGDSGFGVIDELSGIAGFMNANDTNEYAWPAQPGAMAYEAARSTEPDFSATCVLFSTAGTAWNDGSQPGPGKVFYYLSRAVSPNLGSWGTDSSGAPRTMNCLPLF